MVRPAVSASRGSLSRVLLAVTACFSLLFVTSCGLLNGSQGSSESTEGITTLSVGTLPAVDVAPMHLAIQKGWFKQAGLKLELTTVPGGAAGIPKLANGSLDITFGNWVSFIRAQATGTADLKMISDAYQADEGSFLLMHMPGGEVTKPSDLAGKKIAVNTRANIMELLTTATLKRYGVDPASVQFVTMGFPDMPAALKSGDVAAAAMIEPFISKSNLLGAEKLVDIATGPTANMPIAGYGATQKWVQQHREIAAKFQRVMERAQAKANGDRSIVVDLLPKYTKIKPKTAALVAIGTYPTSLDAGRLKRVVGLMKANGELPKGEFDINAMLFQAPETK